MKNLIASFVARVWSRKYILFEVLVALILPLLYVVLYKQIQVIIMVALLFLVLAIIEIWIALQSLSKGQIIISKKMSMLSKKTTYSQNYQRSKHFKRPLKLISNIPSIIPKGQNVHESEHLTQFVRLLEESYQEISQGREIYIQLTKIQEAMDTENFERLLVETRRAFPSLLRLEKDRNGEPLVRLNQQ